MITYGGTCGIASFILSLYVGDVVGKVHAAAFFTPADRAIGDWFD